MGEASRAQQSQSESQTQPLQSEVQTSSQTQPKHESATTASLSSTEVSSLHSTAIEAHPPMELTNVSSPPSKIPLRPRKMRKLSPESGSTGVVDPNTPRTALGTVTTKTAKGKPSISRAVVLPRISARPLSCEGEVEAAIRYLRNADPLLAGLIDVHPLPRFDSFQTPFLALIRSILYQQLAFKAGTSIYTRFVSLCGGENGVVPETVLALTPQQLRQIGVSGRKASYLHDLARKYQNGILSDPSIVNMDDKSLFAMLTMVNGIGSWSVHMFMIFSLHRPDVLPINDLGVRKGVQMLYSLNELPKPSQMDQLCEKWRPYRSVASWYLWRLVDAKGTPSSAAAVAAGVALPQPPQEEQQSQPQPQQPQPQILDQFNGMFNIGACTWGQ